MTGRSSRVIEYWVTCALDPWPELATDDAFGEIVDALRSDGEYAHDGIELSLVEDGPAFVPTGSAVLHVVGPGGASWDEVLELLDAIAAAGEGVVYAEDRQIVLDRRTVKPGVQAFKEQPGWAVALAARHPGLHVVVRGPATVADPVRELSRVGLASLAARVAITAIEDGLEVRGERETDVLVAGQVLAHATRGRAVAVTAGGATEELPP
jgi:hypothetical protein